jgi:8-oxo-dGDP phosphatase
LSLEHASEQPYTTRSSRELARSGRFALVVDEIDMPDGSHHQNRWFRATSAAFIVPVFDDLTTVLVRQWRHPWRETSWEVPAGTLEEDEEPLDGARRELEEEAGLLAGTWEPLGVQRPSALLDARQFLFLARDLRAVSRAPERYEADMITRRLPLAEAVEEALAGGIAHATAVSALCRAAWRLGRLTAQGEGGQV